MLRILCAAGITLLLAGYSMPDTETPAEGKAELVLFKMVVELPFPVLLQTPCGTWLVKARSDS